MAKIFLGIGHGGKDSGAFAAMICECSAPGIIKSFKLKKV